MKAKVLFVIKKSLGYNGTPVPSKGLFNSATFVVNALTIAGINGALVEVVDGNCIDRVVSETRPTHCIIEALWATPEKVEELQRLHPQVQFVVRVHSKAPFIACEGIAIEWLRRYDCAIGFNSLEAAREMGALVKRPFAYLPNIYAPGIEPSQKKLDRSGPNVWIGSLGAIRPLKNQLQQALAAMEYAESTRRHLYFHINDRIEQGGESIQKNIRALFNGTPHRLIEHPWCESHAELLHIVASLDISTQVSFSETFNLATADAVWCGVPAIASSEVEWLPARFQAKPTDNESIVMSLGKAERHGAGGARRNLEALQKWNTKALYDWQLFLNEVPKRSISF